MSTWDSRDGSKDASDARHAMCGGHKVNSPHAQLLIFLPFLISCLPPEHQTQ